MARITFENLPNTRDLGATPCADGRVIANGALIRSGSLEGATESDCAKLLDEYRLSRVIDFRTDMERAQKPDKRDMFPGVQFIEAPALSTSAVGITHENLDPAELQKLAQAVMADPLALMSKIYPTILLDSAGVEAYTRFFDVLLDDHDGAVLWHCTYGKDRAGLATMLLLTALGADRATIKHDYLATNIYFADMPQEAFGSFGDIPLPPAALEGMLVINSARTEYLDAAYAAVEKAYGSVGAYLEEALGVDAGKRETLQERYLTLA